jgi:hypothetical protein
LLGSTWFPSKARSEPAFSCRLRYSASCGDAFQCILASGRRESYTNLLVIKPAAMVGSSAFHRRCCNYTLQNKNEWWKGRKKEDGTKQSNEALFERLKVALKITSMQERVRFKGNADAHGSSIDERVKERKSRSRLGRPERSSGNEQKRRATPC